MPRKRLAVHLTEVRTAQAKLREAQYEVHKTEMELVETLMDIHIPELLRPNYTNISLHLRHSPDA